MSQKWGHLKGRYENTPLGRMSEFINPSYIARVEELKTEFGDLPQADLLKAHEVETELKRELESKIKETHARIEAISQLLIEILESQGVTSVNTVSGSLSISIAPHVTVMDKEALHHFVEGNEDLSYMWSVNHSTLTSWVKSLIEEGKDAEIPECLKIMLKTSIGSRY